jgi:hypothetical protein
MGCNCASKNKATAWVYVAANGTQKRYASEVEALAAKVRAGGGGFVKAV